MNTACFLPPGLYRLIGVLLIPSVMITHPPAASASEMLMSPDSQRSMKIEGGVVARAEGPKQSLNGAGFGDFFAALSVPLRGPMPSHPPDARNDNAEGFSDETIESVRALLEAGKADDALKLIEDMTSEDSPNDKVLYQKAVAYLLKMSEDQAETLLKQIGSTENPGISGDAYFQAGRILLKESEKAHAGLHYLNRAVSFSPDKREPVALLLKEHGIALAAVKPWLSHRMLDKAVQFLPSLKEDDRFYFIYKIQTVTAPRQQIEAAVFFVDRHPKSQFLPEALYKKAEALYMLGDFSPSKSVFREIAETYPETPQGKKSADRLSSWKEFRQKIVTLSPGSTPMDTGLTVEKGDRLIISAQGFSKEGMLSQGPEGRKKKGDASAGLPLPSASPMALIGKIGAEGPWFFIGNSLVGQTDRSGGIMLMMNRPQNAATGSEYGGSYSVMVRVE